MTANQNPFDGLLSFSEATSLWGLNESTLRKAIVYGKLTLTVRSLASSGLLRKLQ